MARKKTKRNNSIIFLIVISLVVALGHLAEKYTDFSWDDIYKKTGLANSVAVSTDVSVHYIDVGQGDCQLIVTANEAVLVDSGEKKYSDTVISYLNGLGLSKIDYIIATHPHSDHIGGMANIINAFATGEVIMPDIAEDILPTTGTFENFLKAIGDNNAGTLFAKEGDVIQLTDSQIEIIAPVKDYDDLNDYSVVIKFIHGGNSFLFTGDIEEQAENDIVNAGADLSADVLKVPHHGSGTSSTKQFLLAVNPAYGIVGVGADNSYGHPHDNIVERYVNLGIELYRTDLNGNIVIESDGESLNIITEKQR